MLTLLGFVAGWAEGWLASGRTDLVVAWEDSPSDRDKLATWITIQGPVAWGQLTVWETGEVTLEAMDVGSGDLIISESTRVDSTELVGQMIGRLVAACEG
jgi:hypothetical protein